MEGEWEALIRVSPRETAANVFFVDSLLAATHDSVRELHYLLSLLLDAACQAMTKSRRNCERSGTASSAPPRRP